MHKNKASRQLDELDGAQTSLEAVWCKLADING